MPTLNDPLKAIFVSVYDMVGNQLASSVGDGQVSVVSVRYKFDDEDDDTCIIKLQMAEPKALDTLGIERGTKLQLIFGYLGNRVSPINSVLVRDMTSKYGSNMIYTELQCTDYLTWLKTSRSSDIASGAIIDYIKAQVYGKYRIVIKDRDKLVYVQSTRTPQEDEDQLLDISVPDVYKPFAGNVLFDQVDYVPTGDIQNLITRTSTKDTYKVTEYKEVPKEVDLSQVGYATDLIVVPPKEVGTWHAKDGDIVKEYLQKTMNIPTSNRSTFVVLQDLFKACPRGPWFVTGRGNILLIHNRDLGKSIYREYIYQTEPGDLIDFTAKTKFENFDKEIISYAGLDPKNRTNFFITDYREALYAQRSPKEILNDKEITDEEKKKLLLEYANLRLKAYAKWGIDKKAGYWLYAGTDKAIWMPGHLDQTFVKKYNAVPYAARDNTGEQNPDPRTKSSEVQFDPNQDDEVLRTNWYTMPLLSREDAVNVTNSRQRELEMEKEEASIIVEGDPWLKSEITIRISNVHTQHEGHYYIKKCEHILTNQGFKTQMDCIKVNPTAMISTLTDIQAEVFDNESGDMIETAKKQYLREQNIFGPDVQVSINVKVVRENLPGATGAARESKTVIEKRVTSLNQLLYEEGFSVDQAIDEIIRVNNTPGALASFGPENQ